MSQWTHISGVLRVDSILDGEEEQCKILTALMSPIENEKNAPSVEKHARAINAGVDVDIMDIAEKYLLPFGSEGPVTFRIIDAHPPWHDEFGSSSTAARWVVAIYGDLRDYTQSDFKNIDSWVKSLRKSGLRFRQGIIEARTQRYNRKTKKYDEISKEWKL